MRGAKRIFAIDTNPGKFEIARQLGATDCVNPADHDKPIQEVVTQRSEALTTHTRPLRLLTQVGPAGLGRDDPVGNRLHL